MPTAKNEKIMRLENMALYVVIYMHVLEVKYLFIYISVVKTIYIYSIYLLRVSSITYPFDM